MNEAMKAHSLTDTAGGVPGPARRSVVLAFSGLLLAMLLASLDQTIVATALPTIVGDLGSLNQISWVVTAYLLGSMVSTPLWGRFGDVYGRQRVFLVSILLFLAGSALCGLAGSMLEIIGFRALQGLGAGGLMALAMALVADIVPPRDRGQYQGYIQVVYTLASVAGPLLGGVLVDHATWRWVFYVNLPVGAVALLVTILGVRIPATRATARIDYVGAALLVATVTPALLLLALGGTQVPFGSPPSVLLGAVSLVSLVTFVWWERRVSEPILPLRLFREPVVAVVSVTLFLATMSLFAVIMFMPLFLQVVTGASPTGSGLLLLPMMLGVTATSIGAGYLMSRTGRYKVFPVAGMALSAVAVFLLSRMDARASQLAVSLALLLFGAGFGMVSGVLTVAIQNAVDPRLLGTATAAANFFRALGGTLGVPIFGAVFAGQLADWLRRLLPAGSNAHLGAGALQASPGEIRALPGDVRDAVVQAVAHSIDTVLLVAVPVALLAVIAALLLKEHPQPKSTGGAS